MPTMSTSGRGHKTCLVMSRHGEPAKMGRRTQVCQNRATALTNQSNSNHVDHQPFALVAIIRRAHQICKSSRKIHRSTMAPRRARLAKLLDRTSKQRLATNTSILSPKTGSSWLIALIRKQWIIAWEIWDYHNCVVHDKDKGINHQWVADAIRDEYAAGSPSLDTCKFFRIPLREMVKRNIDYQAHWLHRITVHRAWTHRKDTSLQRLQACMAAFLGLR
jgi:hypothetical protein